MNQKILIIEDDHIIRSELAALLKGGGYEVYAIAGFSTNSSADYSMEESADSSTEKSVVIPEIKAIQPHLILLDIKLPGISGFSLCSQIRSFSNVPIIFVTSCNTDMDELNSIMLGGDAFITKPYNTAILLAKIASLLKRAYPDKGTETLSYHGVILHLERSKIEYAGHEADLTKNELKILYYLFAHSGMICARTDIVEYLWDNQLYVDDNALSVNINRIRDKLSAIGLTDFIKTKHRQGYSL